jgi:hypothetical protein
MSANHWDGRRPSEHEDAPAHLLRDRYGNPRVAEWSPPGVPHDWHLDGALIRPSHMRRRQITYISPLCTKAQGAARVEEAVQTQQDEIIAAAPGYIGSNTASILERRIRACGPSPSQAQMGSRGAGAERQVRLPLPPAFGPTASRETTLLIRKVQEHAAAEHIPGAAKLGSIWTFDPMKVRAWIAAEERKAWRGRLAISTSVVTPTGAAPRSPESSIELAYGQLIHGKRRVSSRPGRSSSSAR